VRRRSVEIVEALVQIGSVEVPYVRAGRGEATLLLGIGKLRELAVSSTFRRLAAECRVIGAVAPAGCGTGWLRDLIDALGLDRPMLLVHRSLADLAGRFAAEHPERVGDVGYADETAGETDRPLAGG
jgi:pimeloyl-ACP methyl ester carboxylesterase